MLQHKCPRHEIIREIGWLRNSKTSLIPVVVGSSRCQSRVGAVVRALVFHQCVPGINSRLRVISGLSLLVLYSGLRG